MDWVAEGTPLLMAAEMSILVVDDQDSIFSLSPSTSVSVAMRVGAQPRMYYFLPSPPPLALLWAAALCARAAKLSLATWPPLALAVAL